uniref:Uncharacterized protein n=1 Tax=Lygus hesperus TaxID=30085 RepID=A0A146LJH1_LYGHE
MTPSASNNLTARTTMTAAISDPCDQVQCKAGRTYPNARNYGGTAVKSGVTMFPTTQRNRLAKMHDKRQKMQDRVDFLRALLHDEMSDRLQAEQLRTELER